MRIREIHLYQKDLPVKGGSYKLARTEVKSLDSSIVEIITDTGLKGYGETCPIGPVYQPQHALGARAALCELAPHLIGLNPLHIQSVRRIMDESLNGHNYAKAAIDIALWDIAGKHFNMRVCDLLGGALRENIPSYYATSVSAPEKTAAMVKEKIAEGYTRIQVKVGGRPLEEDLAAIRLVAEVLKPGIRLAIDANRGWTTRDVMFISQQCADIAFVLEQPCNTLDEILKVRPMLRHPVYLDENTEDIAVVLRAISSGVCDGFGLKVTRLGGLSVMRMVRDLCQIHSMPHTCDDSWGGDIIAAACTHIGATVDPKLSEGVWLAEPYIEGHYDSHNGIHIKGGFIALPKGPGLGVYPDEGVLGKALVSFA
ncbi:MAG: mandelate racemase/muconate lactonizing enzyme family protein [Deinococcales bacterium]